ncbi:MAG: hypothetical protein JNJ58_02065 [Chitinophagaceae bacterium]|nr:hypothetical protein [Chitinophagaceae bacterium]
MLKSILGMASLRVRVFTNVALFIGFLLLLLSVQLYVDALQILHPDKQKNSEADFLVVNKTITNDMMGRPEASYFTPAEIEALRKLKGIDGLSQITSNRYAIEAHTLGELAFSSQLFFESMPDEYLDITPKKWTWQAGQKNLPIVLSADFLNLYNFGFALSQGLPQLSEETIQTLSFSVRVGNGSASEEYIGEVVGFTQRYSSVLVPQSFMQYANQQYGQGKSKACSRLILQTREPDQPELVQYLKQHHYATQNDKLKLSRIRTIVDMVFGAGGFVALFILILSFMVLLLYIRLLIAEASHKLELLTLLGYTPSRLQKHFTGGSIKILGLILIMSMLGVAALQFMLASTLKHYFIELSFWPAWQTILVLLLVASCIAMVLRHNVQTVIAKYL